MTDAPTYCHGTRAALTVGDLIEPGYASNYSTRKQAAFVDLSAERLEEMHGHLEKLTQQGIEAIQE